MEDPSGGYRPDPSCRRAGEGGGQGVRDWQKNTWFGPAPVNSNPFDEPDDAPELKDFRSANVNEHVGDFWQPHNPDPYGRTAEEAGTRPQRRDKAENGKKNVQKKHFPVFIVLILGALAVFLILRFAVFTVRDIRVIGNRTIAAEEIIRISGVRQGNGILTLDEKLIEQKIGSDYRLQFRYMNRQLPDTVELCVREREECCWLTYCGIIYVMDKNRMVMREMENPEDRPEQLVEIKGLELRSNTLVGQEILLGNETQEIIFRNLFLHMKVLSCTDLIKEADISNTDSILLETRDGYTVSLGDKENMHAKLRSMLLVRDELRRMQKTGGTINVTNPETPIYTPAL